MQNATNRTYFQQGRSRVGSNSLDKNAFMQMLLTKLQNQDPLNPTSDEDFFSQQTQLASMEKMDNLATAIQASANVSQASNIVGKIVEIKNDSGQTTVGRVTSVTVGSGDPIINVNGNNYKMGNITQVFAEPPSS
jgi:flagellar basal-body rod modification protein FlgD